LFLSTPLRNEVSDRRSGRGSRPTRSGVHMPGNIPRCLGACTDRAATGCPAPSGTGVQTRHLPPACMCFVLRFTAPRFILGSQRPLAFEKLDPPTGVAILYAAGAEAPVRRVGAPTAIQPALLKPFFKGGHIWKRGEGGAGWGKRGISADGVGQKENRDPPRCAADRRLRGQCSAPPAQHHTFWHRRGAAR